MGGYEEGTRIEIGGGREGREEGCGGDDEVY